MTPAVAILRGLAVLFALCALVPVATSAFIGYRAGERAAISIGAISGLVLLMSSGLLACVTQPVGMSREGTHFAWFGIFFTGEASHCIFLGTLAGYIGMAFLRNAWV